MIDYYVGDCSKNITQAGKEKLFFKLKIHFYLLLQNGVSQPVPYLMGAKIMSGIRQLNIVIACDLNLDLNAYWERT